MLKIYHVLSLTVFTLVSCQHSPEDAALSSAITSSFINYPPVNLQRVDVYVEHGLVYLSGEVENKEERLHAAKIARQTPGVKQVINKLQVVP